MILSFAGLFCIVVGLFVLIGCLSWLLATVVWLFGGTWVALFILLASVAVVIMLVSD